ncbi:MAG: RtcB family protein [Planctomycetia bacterium]|nr:RtcB family protein [Planctomycetia bacterium]
MEISAKILPLWDENLWIRKDVLRKPFGFFRSSIKNWLGQCCFIVMGDNMDYHDVLPRGPAFGILPVENRTPVRVVGNEAILKTFDEETLQQISAVRRAPGVTDAVLNPDAHPGYGAPIGCVLVSPSHLYPGPVGVDIKCSMSLLQLDIPTEELAEKSLRRALINAIEERITTGYRSSASLKKAPKFSDEDAELVLLEGASEEVCRRLDIPLSWTQRCEDFQHKAHDGSFGPESALRKRLEFLKASGLFGKKYPTRLRQLGTYGGGNHFAECEDVRLADDSDETKRVAEVFGLKPGCAAFLSHCGSRGFGNILAKNQFRLLKEKFELWGIPFPGGDTELVYAPIGTAEANDYQDDLALAGNLAVVNHLLINRLILEAFQEVLPGTNGELVYYISHNFIRREPIGHENRPVYVHRKGATRAYPAGHFILEGTPFYETGHPILLPGNPVSGSSVMVAQKNAEQTAFSINHGAGRIRGRNAAVRELNQQAVDQEFADADILTNCRQYPVDEAPSAYKNFDDVLNSVVEAGLAREVARLHARFVIKDTDS